MKFTKNTFIKWTSKDSEGSFSHVGEVISHKNGMIRMNTQSGVMNIPEDDGSFKAMSKPLEWKPTTTVTSVKRPARKIKKATTTATKAPSGKVKMVVDLFIGRVPATRKEAIAKIVDAGISTPAGASTFWNSAKKHLDL